jgi:hypothetical protein
MVEFALIKQARFMDEELLAAMQIESRGQSWRAPRPSRDWAARAHCR